MFTALFIEFNQNDWMANWYSALDRPRTLGLITETVIQHNDRMILCFKKWNKTEQSKRFFVSLFGDRVYRRERARIVKILLWLFLLYKQVQAT